MKYARLFSFFAILLGILVLAQTNAGPLSDRSNGSLAAQQSQLEVAPNLSQVSQGPSVPQQGPRAFKPTARRRKASAALGASFANAVVYDSGGSGPASVAVADVNGDGKPDIVVANNGSSTVGVLLGNGDGTFQPAVVYGSGGAGASSVAVADVNGDGNGGNRGPERGRQT